MFTESQGVIVHLETSDAMECLVAGILILTGKDILVESRAACNDSSWFRSARSSLSVEQCKYP